MRTPGSTLLWATKSCALTSRASRNCGSRAEGSSGVGVCDSVCDSVCAGVLLRNRRSAWRWLWRGAEASGFNPSVVRALCTDCWRIQCGPRVRAWVTRTAFCRERMSEANWNRTPAKCIEFYLKLRFALSPAAAWTWDICVHVRTVRVMTPWLSPVASFMQLGASHRLQLKLGWPSEGTSNDPQSDRYNHRSQA